MERTRTYDIDVEGRLIPKPHAGRKLKRTVDTEHIHPRREDEDTWEYTQRIRKIEMAAIRAHPIEQLPPGAAQGCAGEASGKTFVYRREQQPHTKPKRKGDTQMATEKLVFGKPEEFWTGNPVRFVVMLLAQNKTAKLTDEAIFNLVLKKFGEQGTITGPRSINWVRNMARGNFPSTPAPSYAEGLNLADAVLPKGGAPAKDAPLKGAAFKDKMDQAKASKAAGLKKLPAKAPAKPAKDAPTTATKEAKKLVKQVQKALPKAPPVAKKFCPHCGATIVSMTTKTCPACHKELSATPKVSRVS